MPVVTQPDHVIAGRYRLLSMLGTGGMGTVWRARDELLDRPVAVKEVAPPTDATADEGRTLRERTLHEARTAARLSHPNIVTVYDVVEDAGRPWIVMELVDARSLREVVEYAGPLRPQQTAAIGAQLLSALRAAHALGIVHRDVKPGNVLIDSGGRAVLADFGIARTLDSPSITRSGVIVGSPAYTAPERARGERGGPESDLWSLGATLYAAVEGRPPYQRDGAWATLNAVASENPDPPSRSGPLWPVLRGLLTLEPAHRLGPEATERLLREVAGTADPLATEPLAQGPRLAPLGGAPAGAAASAELAQAERTRAFHGAAGGHDAEAAPAGGAAARQPPPDRRSPYPALPRGNFKPSSVRRRRWPILLATAVVVAMAAGSLIALNAGRQPATSASGQHRQPGRSASPNQASSPPATRPSASGGQPGSAGASGTSGPGTGHSPGTGPVPMPAGYHPYRDPTGFSIGVPDGWAVSHQGNYVYITPPAGSMYLLIDQTTHPKPDPLADWREQEAARRSTYPDYRLIRLEAVNYPQAQSAADWEFTYTASSGHRHVLNRNVLANSRQAYALYWTTPADQWAASYHFLRAFARTFRPAPA